MDWKCFIGFHKWEKWKDIGEATVKFLYFGRQPAVLQERRCLKCRKAQRRMVTFNLG